MTGASEDNAINYLSMTEFNLQEAAQLFFAAAGDGGGMPQPVAPPAPSQEGGRAASHHHVSRLYDDEPHQPRRGTPPFQDPSVFFQRPQQQHARYQPQPFFTPHGGMLPARHHQPQTRGRVEEIPSDGENENEDLEDDSTVDGDDYRGDQGYAPNVDALFRPPNYVFRGTFAKCCEKAMRQNKWVILNILRRGEFRSGCLNRDIWREGVVRDMIPPAFELFQMEHDSSEGRILVQEYRITTTSIPCIWFINPLTKAVEDQMKMGRLAQSNGSFSLQTFLDELTTFLENHPAEFARMSTDELSPHKLDDEEAGQGIDFASTAQPTFTTTDDSEEEAMLAAALAASEQTAKDESIARQNRSAQNRSVAPIRSPSPQGPAPQPAAADGQERAITPVASTPTVEETSTIITPDISAYVASNSVAGAFRLRFRVPSGSLEVCVTGGIPVSLLMQYVAHSIHMANTTLYPQPPQIELRGGFPPKPLEVPPAGLTLGEWGCLRPNDTVLVHLL